MASNSYSDPGKYGGRPAAPPAYTDPGKYGGFVGAGAAPVPRPADEQPIAPGGGDFGTRAAASFKLTDEGKGNFLRERYGQDNVTTERGETLVREGPDQPWKRFDPTGFDAGDLGDLAPDALITAATLGESVIPRVMVKAGAAAAGTQAVGATIPGEDPATFGDRAGAVATEAGLAGAGELGGRYLIKGIDLLRPSNLMGRFLNRQFARAQGGADASFAREGDKIADTLGVDLSPGARSGSKVLTAAENLARQSLFSAEKAFRADRQVADQFRIYVHNLTNRLGSPGMSTEAVGTKLRDATTNTVKRILETQDKHIAPLYRQAVKEAGAAKFPLTETRKALDGEIAHWSKIKTPEGQAILRNLTLLKNSYGRGKLDLETAIAVRSYMGKAARGSANIFTEAVDRAQSRGVSAKLFAAINKDFDETALSHLPTEALGDWKAANNLWRESMQSLEFVQKSPLARLVGEDVVDALYSGTKASTKAPEKMAEKVLTLKPSEAAVVRQMVERESPETWQAVKAYVLENALEKSSQIAVSRGERVIPLDPVKFIKALPEGKTLEQIFPRAELAEVNMLVSGLRRWADKSGYNFSGTGPWQETKEVIGKLVSLSARGGATLAGEVVGSRQIAEAMLTPRGRTIIVELTQTPPGTRRAVELAGAFLALSSTRTLRSPEGDADDGEDRGE